jgi:hypothetical protein
MISEKAKRHFVTYPATLSNGRVIYTIFLPVVVKLNENRIL